MPAADARARYLADAVATATPAKRIVLLYDRLWLDIQRAQAARRRRLTRPAATTSSMPSRSSPSCSAAWTSRPGPARPTWHRCTASCCAS